MNKVVRTSNDVKLTKKNFLKYVSIDIKPWIYELNI